MVRLVSLAFLLACLLGCQRESQPAPGPGYEYFPIRVGSFAEFEVKQTNYSLAQTPVTTTHWRRETVVGRYTDAAGQDVYQVRREIRSGSLPWQADSLFLVWRTLDRAFRLENGISEVKLVFPITKGVRWNRNELNIKTRELSEITETGQTKQLGNGSLDNVLTVILQNDSTLLSTQRSSEMYAKNFGLVRKEIRSVNYCPDPECVGQNSIAFGYTKTITLIKYGE